MKFCKFAPSLSMWANNDLTAETFKVIFDKNNVYTCIFIVIETGSHYAVLAYHLSDGLQVCATGLGSKKNGIFIADLYITNAQSIQKCVFYECEFVTHSKTCPYLLCMIIYQLQFVNKFMPFSIN